MKKHGAVKPLVGKNMPQRGCWKDLYFVGFVGFFLVSLLCDLFCFGCGRGKALVNSL